MTSTVSGRLIGVGNSGQMLYSDDAGVNWTYKNVTINGSPERISFTDVVEFGPNSGFAQRRLAAIGAWLEDTASGDLPFVGRTYVFLSDDNGNTWSRQPFPETTVTGTPFGSFDGVMLNRLFVTSDGRLLAYGTTMVSNIFITWSIGGLVYRSNDGVSWTRSTFELGPLEQLAYSTSVGRMVAAGFGTVIDSADGAGWNGYLMRDANITLPSGAMSTVTKRRLSLEDIVIHGSTYVAEAATYVPYDPAGTISTGITDQLFNLSSASPFGGARAWTGTELTARYGKLVSDGATLARVGPQGVFTSSNNGASWAQATSNPVVVNNAIARSAGGTYFGIGFSSTSNNGDAVWSSSNLSTWTKIYDRPTFVDLIYGLGSDGNTIYACAAPNSSINALYASTDNGETWALRQANLPGCVGKLVKRGNRLLFPNFAAGVTYSDDNGLTWQSLRVLPGTDSGATALTVTATGRLILGATGKITSFAYISDDGGNTWSGRSWPVGFGELVNTIAAVGGSRVIASTQFNPPFSPRLMVSDDNGDTWRMDTQLQSVPGLPVSGGSLLAPKEILRSPSGRLILRGVSEILTSDDNGNTWTYRFGTFFTNGLRAGEWWAGIYDLCFLNGRWIMPMEMASFEPVRDNKFNWMLISDDDGNTWYRKEIPSSFAKVRGLIAGANQRAVVFGTRGAVWLSDGSSINVPAGPRFFVRAGDMAHIEVTRPPIPGLVQMRYSAVQDRTAAVGSVATAGTDYTATAGILEWLAADTAPKFVDVQTINTQATGANKQFALQLIPENIDLASSATISITIMNVTQVQAAGLETLEADNLVLSPGGPGKVFRVVLRRAPTADVTVTLSANGPSAASFAPGVLTFTSANWQTPQPVTVTPTAIAFGSSYRIDLRAASADTLYQNLSVYGVNYRYPAVAPGPFSLVTVQSRKVHGAAGPFDIPIDTLPPISGSVSVEPRSIGSGHTLVFQFDTAISSVGSVSSSAGSATAAISGNDVMVTLTGIADNARATVALLNVNNAGVNAVASIGFLIGDLNGTRAVNAIDISGAKARANQTVSGANFKVDVNLSGTIETGDISAVKARSGQKLQ
ncbi:MAG: hypothetical protein IPP88_19340 [Betaproteobacteria bacterium]|nr:hypothetical protein [Betaproteobacteria bacterium]